MQFRVTRSARKHRIGNDRITFVLERYDPISVQGDVTVYVGFDNRGVELEIATVPDDKHTGGQAVIHAMPRAYRRREG